MFRFVNPVQRHIGKKHYVFGMGLPVLVASELLNTPSHQHALSQLPSLTGLSASDYQSNYLSFVHHFAEYVQAIPAAYDAKLGTLFNHSLQRGMYALEHYLSDGGSDLLERYAVFTAAMLLDITQVFYKRSHYITHATGTFIQEWNPFLGSLVAANADYYRIMPMRDHAHLSLSIGMIAEKLLPMKGWCWITNDRLIFSHWLAALYGMEVKEASRLMLIIQLLKQQPISALEDEFSVTADLNERLIEHYEDTQYADAFLPWLQDEWENGHIQLDHGISTFAEGHENKLFLSVEIIDRFLIRFPGISLMHILQQFRNLLGHNHVSYRPQHAFLGPKAPVQSGIVIPALNVTMSHATLDPKPSSHLSR